MIKWLLSILFDEQGGLGIVRGSIVSACADDTGDDSSDAYVKIRRLINRRGRSFCNITDWPFRYTDISFDITSSDYKYSGSSYLPANFKKVIAGHIEDENDNRYPLIEVDIQRAHEWGNPNDNQGRPDEFCITRIESGYWQIQFNRLPDGTYTVYLEIEQQWTDIDESSDGDTTETVITQEYFDAFTHYVDIGRFKQQGDLENYKAFKDDWWNPLKPQDSLLGKILAKLGAPLRQPKIEMDMEQAGALIFERDTDYNDGPIG